MRGGGDYDFSPLGTIYGQTPGPNDIQDLTIQLADLPRLSLPGDVDPEPLIPLEQLLPPSLVAIYRHPVVLHPRPKRSAKGVHLVSPEVYHLLIDLLVQRRMIAFIDKREVARDGRGKPVYNGLFKVDKDDRQYRLIMDGRPSNSLLPEPANPDLPSPESVLHGLRYLVASQRMRLENCLIWKRDIRNFYYRLEVPKWMVAYQALPPMDACNTASIMERHFGTKPPTPADMVPCLQVLTMGMSHSVLLAQSITRYQLHLVMARMTPEIQRNIFVEPYIDDINIVAKDGDGCLTVTAIEAHFEDVLGLRFKKAKNVDRAPSAELIGVELRCAEGKYGVSALRQKRFVNICHA